MSLFHIFCHNNDYFQKNVSYCMYKSISLLNYYRSQMTPFRTIPPNEYNFSFFQIFQALEHPEEAQKLKILQNLTIIQRENFMNFILNGTWKNYVEPKKEIGDQLSDYELTVAQAAIGGIDMATKTPIFQWSYIQSVFFTSTILTTIGK